MPWVLSTSELFLARQAGNLPIPAIWPHGPLGVAVRVVHANPWKGARSLPGGDASARLCHHSKGQAALQRTINVSLLRPSILGHWQERFLFNKRQIPMFPRCCCCRVLGRNRIAASRTACHSIIPYQFFSSTLILASGPLSEPVIHSSWSS